MTSVAPLELTPVPVASRAGPSWTDASLVFMAVAWGANFAAMKLGARQFPPLAFNASRLLVGTLILLVIAVAQQGGWPSRATAWRLLALGIIGNGLYQVCFVEALVRTRVANVAIMLASTPVWLALVGQLMGTEHLKARAWSGIGLSIVGIVLVVLGGAAASGGGHSWTGNLIALAGVACWCTYTVLLRPYTESTNPIKLHAITLVGGTVPLVLLAAPQLAITPWRTITWDGWTALAYGAVMAIVVAYLLWYRGVRLLGPTRTAMYGNLQPIVALIVGAAMLGEVPTMAQGVGCALTVGGLLLART